MNFALLGFALMAALSPVAFAASLAVIQAGRVQALSFGTAFVVTQFIVCAVLVLLGGWSIPNNDHGHETLRALLEVLFGLWVLMIAANRNRRPRPPKSSHSRTQAVIDRLGKVHMLTALAAGVLLGIGGPKRLVITALAAASIADRSGGSVNHTAEVGVYTVIATALVWAPVLTFEIAGKGAVDLITRATTWTADRGAIVMTLVLLAVGAFAVVDGVRALL